MVYNFITMKKQSFERTSIYKRLYGKTLSEMATEFGCCAVTVLRMHKMGELEHLKKKDAIGYIDRRIMKIWNNAWSRCNMPEMNKYEYYGGNGIKCELSAEETVYLWKRDGADNMKCPSLDRIDRTGNYSVENCRFIEFELNRRLRDSLYASEFLKDFLKNYKSMAAINRIFGISTIPLLRLLNGFKSKRSTCKDIALKLGLDFDKCFEVRE